MYCHFSLYADKDRALQLFLRAPQNPPSCILFEVSFQRLVSVCLCAGFRPTIERTELEDKVHESSYQWYISTAIRGADVTLQKEYKSALQVHTANCNLVRRLIDSP